MKTRVIYYHILVIILLGISESFAQQADTNLANKAIQDSLMNVNLSKINEQLKQSESQRIQDSLKRLELQKELELSRTTDYIKRKELEEKLNKLRIKDSLREIERTNKIAKLKKEGGGFPVNPFGDTLFFLFTKTGPFTPKERADNISSKIKKIYKKGKYFSDSLKIVSSDNTADIVYSGIIIMSVTDLDALWNESEEFKLADNYKTIIDNAIISEKKEKSLLNILLRIGGVILVIAGLWIIIYFVNRITRYLKVYIQEKLRRFLKPINIKSYELLSIDKLIKAILFLNKIIRILIILVVIYLALPLIFSVFPATKSWANILIDWIISPVRRIFTALFDYLPNLITVVVVFIATRYLVKFVRFLSKEIESEKLKLPGFLPEWSVPTYHIVRFLLYAFMFVIIFPYLPGSDSPVFKGVSVFLGLLLSLGSTSAISNIIAGLVITYMRPFKIGDRIKIGEVTGDVIEKSLLVTRIRSIKNEEITIPNSSVLSGHTMNYSKESQEHGLILHTSVTIGYDISWQTMHKALIDAALKTNFVLEKPAPFVLQTSLDDFYVTYQLNAYTHEANKQALIYSELHGHILDICNEREIEIMSPHYQALREGNRIALPPDYIPANYTSPSFKVDNKNE
ncbi:mechanosensitive ion channel domain-containing protein [Bacteroidota bacterium]